MAISLDKAFSLHEAGMVLRSQRAEIIASNIANSDTPGYKAKDMDFKKAMQAAVSQQKQGMSSTHEKHFNTGGHSINDAQYRIPDQPDTGDGNTVNVQMERNLYLKNSLEYQASVQFLNGRVKGLKKAISGGQ